MQPLGDQAVLLHFTDENDALRFAAAVRRDGPPWLVDVVQAYAAAFAIFSAFSRASSIVPTM